MRERCRVGGGDQTSEQREKGMYVQGLKTE